MFRLWLQAAGLLWLCGGSAGGSGRLYSEEDPLVILGSSSLKPTVTNSSSAWLVQFYSSWCGHCIQYSSTWKALAQDVKGTGPHCPVRARSAVPLGAAAPDSIQNLALDKLDKEVLLNPSNWVSGPVGSSHNLVKEGITMETTLLLRSGWSASCCQNRFCVPAGADREVRSVRQLMVNILQNHSRTDRPQSCPPLEPYSAAQLLPLLGQRSDHYTAIIVEEAGSFVGREVILDLLQFSDVEVRRALTSDLPLLDVLNMAAFPSVYLLHPNGSHAPLHSEKPLRFFFSSLLRSLPGVQRHSSSEAAQIGALQDGQTSEPWRDFDRSQVYTADLESALHYLLRVELAAHGTLEGAELKVFKDFVALVAKLYPVGGSVVKLMETLSDWLLSLPLQQIPYQAVLDLVDNKMKVNLSLTHTLTHTHTHSHTKLSKADRAEPRTRLDSTSSPGEFWSRNGSGSRHLNSGSTQGRKRFRRPSCFLGSRVSCCFHLCSSFISPSSSSPPGSLSDDPVSPKAPWPSPALCPACHEESNGVHVWNHANVLAFLRRHYGASNLNPSYSLTSPRLPAGAGPAQTRRPQEERPAAGGERKGKDQADLQPIQPGPRRVEQAVLIRGEGGFWILGLGFTSVDMSLCVVLYGSSCLFLMLLFFFFKVRSRRWKLRHARLHV
ncbi:sulfhydryl oxidase 2 [Poecilia reticulata]|uniref:sulfhydryl oxidase 2 n=1 Tax=Poecilia reticulata TaxID=8081 RepID=UPI0007EB000D|nr:PREDICTED: sulfhydryl oxidase 2 [Poecilia reticulata]